MPIINSLACKKPTLYRNCSGLAKSAIITAILTWPSISIAEATVAWIGGAHVSHKTQELEQLLDSQLSFYVLNITGRAIYEDYYVAINAAHSLEDSDVSEEGEFGSASREDYDVTLGWNISPQVTVFGGYKTGKTSIDFTVRESILEDADGDVQASFSDSFKESGVFIGLGYGLSLEEAGQLSFSIAYADMDADNALTGTVDEDSDDEPDEIDFDDLTGTFSGDVRGYSAAAQWTIKISENLLYQALIRYNSYKQEIDDTVQGVDVAFDVDENFYELGMGLLYVF